MMSDTNRRIIILLVGFTTVSLLPGCTNWEKNYRASEKNYRASEKKYKALEKIYTSQLQYQITDLGKVEKYSRGVKSINDNGQIVGSVGLRYVWVETSCGRALVPRGHSRAVLFDPTGAGNNTELGSLGGKESRAHSINNKSQIVGSAQTNSGNVHTCLFDPAGENIDLGEGSAICINDNGEIVGVSGDHACVFQRSGENIDLGTLGGDHSSAKTINNKGQIAGWAHTSSGDMHACLFKPEGENTDLGTLGGKESYALSINDNGQIVGQANKILNDFMVYCACLFDPSGAGNNIDLGTLGGGYSIAYAINDNGQIVGSAGTSGGGRSRACLFDPTGSGANIDLNMVLPESSGWVLEFAISINNNGWIVGKGRNPAGEEHAYLLTPRSNR